jgi:hypothetical protein
MDIIAFNNLQKVKKELQEASTLNNANSIIKRDASGNFSANQITASSFNGDSSIIRTSGTQTMSGTKTFSGLAKTSYSSNTTGFKNVTVSTGNPSGGINGDIWMTY